MSTGAGEPPNPEETTDDDVVLRVVEEFTNTVEESNREQSRIVIVTAIVALVSSVAGPLVALKINSDQIDSQRATSKEQAADQREATTQQNTLERERGEGEFIRIERRAAYSDFLAAYNNGALDLLGISGKYTSGGYPPNAAARDLETMIQTLKDVTRTYYTVNLVGSTDAVANAGQAYAEFASLASDIIDLGGLITNGTPPRQGRLNALSQESQKRYQNNLIPASQAFIETGRDDMKAN